MKKAIIGIVLLVALASIASGQSPAPRSRLAKFEDHKVHYYDVGGKQDKALIFIHGWTCNADFWKDSYSAFPHLRVIAIDLPGHGQSDKPQADYSMAFFARSIEA